jgi:phosphomannomutase
MDVTRNTLMDLASAFGASFGTSGVRGRVADLTPELCHAYTNAFLCQARPQAGEVLIGHDLRPSSPEIAAICGQSARQTGWHAIHAGMLPAPALAFAARERGLPAIMVTGSHVPSDRNGIKFFHAHGEITKEDERAILDTPVPAIALEPWQGPPAADPSILEHYLTRYLVAFPENALAGLHIGVYEHACAGRDVFHAVLRGLGAETISLGRSHGFVAVDTEAIGKEDIDIAPQWIRSHGLDAIVSADGDADRPLLADEHGTWIRGDMLGLFCARELGARSVVTPVNSNTAAERCGFLHHVVRTRIGSPFVIAAMLACEQHPVVGYEANGGFILGSTVRTGGRPLSPLMTRDSLLPVILILSAARRRKQGLSRLIAELPGRHTASGRLREIDGGNLRRILTDTDQVTETLRTLLAPEAASIRSIDRLDGIRILFSDGDIIHVRASGNAPELRCYAEASSPQRAEALCDSALARLAGMLLSHASTELPQAPCH